MVAHATNTTAPTVGVTLSASELSAVIPRASGNRPTVWRTALAARDGDAASWPSLTDAFRALAREVGGQPGSLHVALLAPLSELRVVEVPPLPEPELHQLLVRNAGKYFVSAIGPQVIGVSRVSGGPCLAAASSAMLLHAVHAAARDAGWRVDAIVPAECAWGAAVQSFVERGATSAQLIVAHDAQYTLLQVERARISGVRRLRRTTADQARLADACHAQGVPVFLVGHAASRDTMEAALQARGVPSRVPGTLAPELLAAPEALAAAYVSAALPPALRTEGERLQHAHAARRLAVRLAGVAALLLLSAAALQLWGVQRELAGVRAERDAIRPQLSATLVGRTTVETAFQQLTTLAAAERAAPRWSAVIAGISEQLPMESYLTGFRGRADTVGVDGLARAAARVFDAMERVPLLTDVRASAPVRRETTAEGDALERFQLSALRRPMPADSARRPD
jgi:hypothetical protein